MTSNVWSGFCVIASRNVIGTYAFRLPPLEPLDPLSDPAAVAPVAMARRTVSDATATPARLPPRPQSAFERDSPREPRPQSAFERSPQSFARINRIYPSSSFLRDHARVHTGRNYT